MLLVKCSVEIECRCCCWGKESGLGVIMVLLNEAVDGDWSQMKTLTRVLFPVRPLDVCDTDVFLKTNRHMYANALHARADFSSRGFMQHEKKKQKKPQQHVYQKRAELEYIPFTFIINLDFLLWEKAEPRKISLILKQLRVKCSGATGQWFQTCSFWCRLQLCSSWTPGHQSSRFLDTSACSGSGCADSSLGTSPCSQIWFFFFFCQPFTARMLPSHVLWAVEFCNKHAAVSMSIWLCLLLKLQSMEIMFTHCFVPAPRDLSVTFWPLLPCPTEHVVPCSLLNGLYKTHCVHTYNGEISPE